MRIFWLTICILAIWTTAGAQTATVLVEVEADGQPVAAVTVVINGSPHTTDARGLLTLSVPAGRVEITATKEGFTPITTSVEVAAGQQHLGGGEVDAFRLAVGEAQGFNPRR